MVNDNSFSNHSFTQEQIRILNSTGNIRINAVAGSGKTTTILEYARSRPPGSRILYMAFNKSVKLEASEKFKRMGMPFVRVETAHSLAYRDVVVGSGYSVKSNGYLIHELVDLLRLKTIGEQHSEFMLASHVGKFAAYFCNSDAAAIRKLDYRSVVQEEHARNFVSSNYNYIETCTARFLDLMESKKVDITHDFYLKKYQLSKPILEFDYILFDEAQDASAAMLDVVLCQQATKVIVGDTHQQIYGWRHAVNSLERADFPTYHLSRSFRFNQVIADLAIAVLNFKAHLIPFQPTGIEGVAGNTKSSTKAVIARTNLGLLLRAIEYVTEGKNSGGIYFEGNINSYTYADEGASLYDVLNLSNGKRHQIRDKLIGQMKTMEDLEAYIEKTGDSQLGMMVEIVKKYGNEIHSILKTIKHRHVGDQERSKAALIFSTVHRCKGLEYDEIEIVNDFINEEKIEKLSGDPDFDKTQIPKLIEEINLLYVAITRTRRKIVIHESLLPKGVPTHEQIRILRASNAADTDRPSFKHPQNRKRTELRQLLEQKLEAHMEIRRKHRAAYMPWTADLDTLLTECYCEGMPLDAISELLGRTKGAVLSRILKLGLEELYGETGVLD